MEDLNSVVNYILLDLFSMYKIGLIEVKELLEINTMKIKSNKGHKEYLLILVELFKSISKKIYKYELYTDIDLGVVFKHKDTRDYILCNFTINVLKHSDYYTEDFDKKKKLAYERYNVDIGKMFICHICKDKYTFLNI